MKSLPIFQISGKIHLVLIFFHGSGHPFDVELRLFGVLRAKLLLEAGIAVLLPASPFKDGKVHFWYSAFDYFGLEFGHNFMLSFYSW